SKGTQVFSGVDSLYHDGPWDIGNVDQDLDLTNLHLSVNVREIDACLTTETVPIHQLRRGMYFQLPKYRRAEAVLDSPQVCPMGNKDSRKVLVPVTFGDETGYYREGEIRKGEEEVVVG